MNFVFDGLENIVGKGANADYQHLIEVVRWFCIALPAFTCHLHQATPFLKLYQAFIIFPVESFKEIQDSICVAQRKPDRSEERVILFLKVAPGSEFTKDLVNSVKSCIRNYLSARHVPAFILPCTDIPVFQFCLFLWLLSVKMPFWLPLTLYETIQTFNDPRYQHFLSFP